MSCKPPKLIRAIDPITLQFPAVSATVTYRAPVDFNGEINPKLAVMAFDSYGTQLELTVERTRRAGRSDAGAYYWEAHAYRHPGARQVSEISPDVAARLVARLLHLAGEYPALLFNAPADHSDFPRRIRGMSEGFVRFHRALLDGAPATVKTLACFA